MIKSDQLIRVMLADDHRVLIGSLRMLLERHGCEIVGEATTGEAALALAAKVRPQVVVMDLEMPGTGGLAAAHRMKQVAPAARVLILSAHDDESDVLEALNEAGVAGYLLKSDAPEELVSAIRTVASGKALLKPLGRADCAQPAQAFAVARHRQRPPDYAARARGVAADQRGCDQ